MGGGGFQLRLNRANINKPHGSFFYTLGDSALDASPYSLNSGSSAKPAYVQHRYGVTLGGPLTIPKLQKPSTSTKAPPKIKQNSGRRQNGRAGDSSSSQG